jgi:hypothetical protein
MSPRAFSAEEGAIKLLFELLDRAGERWLSDIAFFGRPREIQASRHGKKISDLMHLHARFMPQVRPYCTRQPGMKHALTARFAECVSGI